MTAYPRDEMDEMVERWLQANRDAEAAGDWRPMADLYTSDATYGWNYGPTTEFMAVGREEIRNLALGAEMGGLDGWSYPYENLIIDDRKGQVIGLWRQVADATRPDGSHYEVGGIGGSWFQYGGNFEWSWQRDFFDFGNAMACFMELIQAGKLSAPMQKRIERVMAGEVMPGHVKHEG